MATLAFADVIWPPLGTGWYVPLLAAFYPPFLRIPCILGSLLIEWHILRRLAKDVATPKKLFAFVLVINAASGLVGLVATPFLPMPVDPRSTRSIVVSSLIGVLVFLPATIFIEGYAARALGRFVTVPHVWRTVTLMNLGSYGVIVAVVSVSLFVLLK